LARDSIEEALAWSARLWQRAKRIRSPLSATAERRGLGLSAKLLLLNHLRHAVEVRTHVPSVANFRINWLNDRLTAAQLAALAAGAVPGGVVPDALRTELLRTAQVRAVALKRAAAARPFADIDSQIDDTFDFRASARRRHRQRARAALRLTWTRSAPPPRRAHHPRDRASMGAMTSRGGATGGGAEGRHDPLRPQRWVCR
jgi:hypothetical protein